jgi:hypothetical protein
MTPQTLFTLTVAVSLVGGLTSPLLLLMTALWPIWYPPVLEPAGPLIFYGASLIVSTFTLLASAVPAALAERMGVSATAAMQVWLGGAALLTGLGVLARL